jgi:hypothetical protein
MSTQDTSAKAPIIEFVSLITLAIELSKSPRELRRKMVERARLIEAGADQADPSLFPESHHEPSGRVFFIRSEVEAHKHWLLAQATVGKRAAHRIRAGHGSADRTDGRR